MAYLWCAQPRGVPKILFRGCCCEAVALQSVFFFFSFCISCWPTIEKTGIRDAAPCETARAFPPSSFSLTLSVCKIFFYSLFFSVCVCVWRHSTWPETVASVQTTPVCVCVFCFVVFWSCTWRASFWRSFLSDVFSWLNWIYSFLLFGLKILPCGVVKSHDVISLHSVLVVVRDNNTQNEQFNDINAWLFSGLFCLAKFLNFNIRCWGIIIGDPIVCSKTRVVSFTGRTAGRWPANPVNREFLLLTILLPMLRPSDQSLCGSRGQIAMVIKSPSLVLFFSFKKMMNWKLLNICFHFYDYVL